MPLYITEKHENTYLVIRSQRPNNAIAELCLSKNEYLIIYSKDGREYKIMLSKPREPTNQDYDKEPQKMILPINIADQNLKKDRYVTHYDYILGKITIYNIYDDDLRQLNITKKVKFPFDEIKYIHDNFDIIDTMKQIAYDINSNKFNLELYADLELYVIYSIIRGLDNEQLVANGINYQVICINNNNLNLIGCYEIYSMKLYGYDVCIAVKKYYRQHYHFICNGDSYEELIKNNVQCDKCISECDSRLSDLIVFKGKAKSARNV